MLANLYNCPVKTASSKEGPALGVALLAATGAGITHQYRKLVRQ